ncbi:MAG: hypothetical protein AAF642_02380 [Pseudomonadota bacterium]
MSSTIAMAWLMALPIILFVIALIASSLREEFAQPVAVAVPQPTPARIFKPYQPRVLSLGDIKALAGIAEHPSMRRFVAYDQPGCWR